MGNIQLICRPHGPSGLQCETSGYRNIAHLGAGRWAHNRKWIRRRKIRWQWSGVVLTPNLCLPIGRVMLQSHELSENSNEGKGMDMQNYEKVQECFCTFMRYRLMFQFKHTLGRDQANYLIYHPAWSSFLYSMCSQIPLSILSLITSALLCV